MSGPERFALDIPRSWKEVDLAGGDLAASRAASLAATDDPRAKAAVNDMYRQGREILRSARKHGALYCAGTATMYDEGLFMGYVMVFAVATPEGYELTLPVLSQQLGVGVGGKVPADRVIASAVVPGVGRVPRVTGTEETDVVADVRMKLLVMHTMMPVPGRERQYLVVTCASPNLPLKDELHDLFDAVTGSFRFLTADGLPVDLTAAGQPAG
ncbi:hypothetical protein [Streptomyces sp. NBC_01497]|uniref:hypothetical protein n=1 Tax=Streptomyces sp. NBC_01497 TaxID=2903885 RepID=UPI002E324FFD|nr:hypothetical protein [Streptomyces sp. NBC_01497]